YDKNISYVSISTNMVFLCNSMCKNLLFHLNNNFKWTAELASELCKQYTKRYGKIHACQKMVDWFMINRPKCNEKNGAKKETVYCKYNYPEGCTPPPLAITDPSYHSRDLVKAYRNYYLGEKVSFCTWNYTKTPYWWKY
ncbi:MAG: hypothetical protein M1486_07010, partial [Gammaproteobacteria bacterium]|nr:hypothetical protein [Gammaproteobacteria bacterium]